MYFIAIFPALMWIGAYVFRRRWPAFAIIFLGLGAALGITNAVGMLTTMEPGDGFTIFHVFAYAYCAVVTLVALMIACQKRGAVEQPCYRCAYDLLGNESGVCPECGMLLDASTAPGPAEAGYAATAAARRARIHVSAKCSPSTITAPTNAATVTSVQ